jgi:hypothetical protein
VTPELARQIVALGVQQLHASNPLAECYCPVCRPMPVPKKTAPVDAGPAAACRKDVGDAWRNCPILADALVNDIYHTALGQVLREQDQQQVGRVVSLAYHLGYTKATAQVDAGPAEEDPLGPVNLNDEEPDRLPSTTPLADDAFTLTANDTPPLKPILTVRTDGTVSVSDDASAAEYAHALAMAGKQIAALRAQLDEANHWRHNYADAVKAVQAEMKAEVERTTRERDIAMCGNDLLIKERDQLKAEVAELERMLLSQEKHAITVHDKLIKERDEARAELAALKGRKVKLPLMYGESNKGDPPDMAHGWKMHDDAIEACADAIRAAGILLEGE